MILQSPKRKSVNTTSKKSIWKWFFISTFTLFFIFNTVAISFIASQLNVIEVFFSVVSNQTFNGVNILAFGVDDTRTSKRADNIILFHLDNSLSHVGHYLFRDTRVEIEGHSKTRVNHAYSYGESNYCPN